MGTDEQISILFHQIKPLTVAIAQKPRVGDIHQLRDRLSQVEDDHLQTIQQYVIFPLTMLMRRRQQVSEKVLLAGFGCMSCILERTLVREPAMFRDLFASCSLVLSQPDGTPNDVSEEMILAGVNVLILLVKNADFKTTLGIYTADFMPLCGHAVSMLLSLAEKHRSRDVQSAAMRAILVLASTDEQDVSRRRDIGCFMSSFLPGVVMTLTRVVTGDLKQGRLVLELGLRCWSDVVCQVLDDRCVPCERERIDDKGNADLARLLVTRNHQWLDATVQKLVILVEKMTTTLTSHQHWAVRLGLVRFSRRLLERCWNSLSPCRRHLLDVCLTLLNDSHADVTAASRDVIADVRRRDDVTLRTLLEEHVYELCTALPRLVRIQGEDENIATLKKLLGYFQLLGGDLSPVMKCGALSRRVYESLVQVCEIDTTALNIIEDRNVLCTAESVLTSAVMTSLPSKPRPHLRYVSGDGVYELVTRICTTVAEYGDVDLLLDLCTESVHQSSLHRKEALFLSGLFVRGAKNVKSAEQMDALVRLLVEEYLQPDLIDLHLDDDVPTVSPSSANPRASLGVTSREPTNQRSLVVSSSVTSPSGRSLKQMNSDLQQTSLVLCGLAECAKAQGPGFRLHLMEALYPVLVCLASNHHVISQTAHLTLADVAHACQYSSLNELVCSNADYLVNAVSLRMRHFCCHQTAPLVVMVMVDVCHDSRLLVYVRDVIDEMLQCLDDHHGRHAARFLTVMRSLVRAVHKWFPTKPENENAPVEMTSQSLPADVTSRLVDYVTDYLRQKLITETLELGDEDVGDVTPGVEVAGDEDGMEIGDGDKKKETPLHVTVVKNILSRCVHLMSDREARLRLLVLDVTAAGLRCLHSHTDELLPLAHLVWAPLTHRFRDEEQLVIVKSFELLCTMADICEDFLSQRVRKEVIPQLASFLRNQASISEQSSSIYRQTVAYKSQLVILKQLGPLATKLKLCDRHVDALYQACRPYLSSKQPQPLQQACTECVRDLMSLEPDLIWLRLVSAHPISISSPVSSQCRAVKLVHKAGSEEFKENVSSLLSQTR